MKKIVQAAFAMAVAVSVFNVQPILAKGNRTEDRRTPNSEITWQKDRKLSWNDIDDSLLIVTMDNYLDGLSELTDPQDAIGLAQDYENSLLSESLLKEKSRLP